MEDIKDAIDAVEDAIPAAVQNTVSADTDAPDGPDGHDAAQTRKVKPKTGQIGEGKGAPLSKNQRKRALYVSALSLAAARSGVQQRSLRLTFGAVRSSACASL